MKKIRNFINKSFNKQIDGTGLAVFRIAYAIVLLCEISQMFYFRHLIFDKIPYLDQAEINFAIPIGIWFISVFFILFGAFTRFFSVLNYILSLILIGSIGQFEYHVFYAYMGLNFMLIFLPISKCVSLDRLFEKLKYSNTSYQHSPSKTVRQIYYFIVPLVGLGIVYIDSVFYKIVTPMWYEGLGSWLPSSLPMISHTDNSFLINQEWVIKFVGWFTIFFEAIFTFIFFRKKWRLITIICGLLLHLGILLIFPIPWFALTACVIYILIVPVSFWKKLFNIGAAKASLFVFYDTECPLCVRTKITVNHFNNSGKIKFKTVQLDAKDYEVLKDISQEELLLNIYSTDLKGNVYNGLETYIQVFSRIWYLIPVSLILRLPGIYHLARKIYNYVAVNRTTERCTDENCGFNPPDIVDNDNIKLLTNYRVADLKLHAVTFFLIFVCFTQAIAISHAWSFEILSNKIGMEGTKVNKIYSLITHKYLSTTKILFGLTHHQVFTDRIHFDNYNHIISVYHQKDDSEQLERLPIIDEKGQPDWYIYGSNWVQWTFRVNGTTINQEILNKGLERYTAFWAKKNNVDLTDAKFIIKVKKVDNHNGWEKDFFKSQIAKPWIDGGYVNWKDEKFNSSIKDIENL